MISILIKNRTLETYIKIFGWVKLLESQTLVWPRAEKTLNTKNDKFWYIHYISRWDKERELQIA